jgi:hypothetical protein
VQGLTYVPYFELTGVPNVIADGHPRRSTVLTLSHWPDSETPEELRRDLSAQIALAYLDAPHLHVAAEAVSNNHLDIDGFMAVWALCNPAAATADPVLVAEVARAGDFGWTDDDRSARVAFALGTLKTAATSTLPPDVFSDSEPQQVANLHRALLDRFDDLVTNIDSHEELWADEYASLETTTAALLDGRVSIDEHPEVDLAVVTVEPTLPLRSHPYCLQYSGPCHPMPIHRATECSRVLYFRGNWAGCVYRFESWVAYQSRRIPPRINLSDLASQLTDRETGGARWTYAWPNNPNPPVAWLSPRNFAPTTIAREVIVAELVRELASAPAPDRPQPTSTYSSN